MNERRRNIVVRPDGRLVNVARFRGQLFVCADGCCCGRTEDGFPPVPRDLFHSEWERRRLRNQVHLTIGGCLGPCALANVVLLLLDGRSLWFHTMHAPERITALYDFIEASLDVAEPLALPRSLEPFLFTAARWQPRPDGQQVDDHRPRQRHGQQSQPEDDQPHTCDPTDDRGAVDAAVSMMTGAVAMPRRNGELVFAAPWQGRAFGMAVALHEQGLYEWETFRDALIRRIAQAEQLPAMFDYYDCWVAAFEDVLAVAGLLSTAAIEERAYEFEFGERDDIF